MELQEIRKNIQEVTAKVNAAGLQVDDPQRPAYHFHAPAQWMDDPNGIIYHKGWYHMMYSLNPDTAAQRAGMVYRTESSKWDPSDPDWTGGRTVWGHARSRDLVHWEHLPIALYPETDKDEYFIWFGCTAINDEGTPVAIYTSIGHKRNPTDSAEQWMWYGEDDELIHWQPFEGNPLITEEAHEGKKIWEWRDPFVFKHGGKAYMILGGKQDEQDGGKAVVLLYEAANPAYSAWNYRGVLFEYPDPDMRGCECPNMARLGDKWVLLLSPFGPVEYFIGDIDFQNCRFYWQKTGKADISQNFYASNVMYDDKGRCLMWGAIEGFANTRGWNGINSLPRHIWLDEAGDFRQDIPEEISALRKGAGIQVKSGKNGASFTSSLLEIQAKLVPSDTACIRLTSQDVSVDITLENGHVSVGGYSVPLAPDEEACFFHIFVDKSVMEVVVGKRNCISVVIQPLLGPCEVTLASAQNTAHLYAWELDGEDLYTYYES